MTMKTQGFYSAPEMETIEVRLEQGIAQSSPGGQVPDPIDGGEFDL
jgi:hypothetical protein